MYFDFFKSLVRGTLRLRRNETSQYIQTVSIVQRHFHVFPSCNRAGSSTIDRLTRIRLKQSVDNYNFCTPCSSIVDLESEREV